MKNLFFVPLLLIIFSCGEIPEEENKVIFAGCTPELEASSLCSRFMDRDVYFAFPDPSRNRNNAFDVLAIKDALTEITCNTFFGCNYFRFTTIDEGLLSTPLEVEETTESFRSYIQVWDDVDFDDLFIQTGPHADPNAILFVNFANKKKFSLILRRSCFSVNSFNCTSDAGANFTQNAGLRALVGRSFMRMFAVNTKDCSLFPADAMCAQFPSDTQWNNFNRDIFFNDMRNAQSAVANNPDFYDF